MRNPDYTIHLSDEKDKYIVVRNTNPRLMIHCEYSDSTIEISRIILMENSTPSALGKILREFEIYVKTEIIRQIGTRAG